MIKKGFTLVEIMLFLGLTGALIALAIAGTARNIASKRYTDTVDNLKNYLDGLYASVSYVSHDGQGDYSKAVYGKLVNMETKTVSGEMKTTFTAYSVIGNATVTSSVPDILSQLLEQAPTLVHDVGGTPSFISEESYSPTWNGRITAAPQEAEFNGVSGALSDSHEQNQILLLIIRHPKNGMTSTYAYYPSTVIDITTNTPPLYDDTNGLIGKTDKTANGNFTKIDANFCIDSDDRWAAGNERRIIRIHAGANNASGVELISNDKKGNFCYDAS